MKTVLMVKFAFAALIVFGILSALGYARLGLDLAVAVSVASSAWMLARRVVHPMELGLAASFLIIATLDAVGVTIVDRSALDAAVPSLLVVQGTIGVISCLIGRPWTSVYAGAQYRQMGESPLFLAVNMVLSALWSVVFFALAALAWFKLAAIYSQTLTGGGLLLSVFGPAVLVRIMLERAVRARETYHWPTPRFDPASHDVDSCDVAIVGAGIGGLTAAALLASAGLKVIVAEHHVVPGGFAHTWLRKVRHDGVPRVFRFDSGVHDISGAHPGGSLHGILTHLGIQLDWVRMTQSMDVDGNRQPIPDDWRDYARALGRLHPGSRDGLMRFFEVTKEIYDGMFSLGRGQSGVPLFPKTASEMLAFARANPVAVEWMHRPFADLASRFVSEPAARQALYTLAGYITDRPEEMSVAEMVPIFGYYFHGGYYPKGGSGVLAQALSAAVTRLGGEVLLKSPVTEILTQTGAAAGIRLASGRIIRSRAVISNADMKRTFTDLVSAAELPKRFAAAIVDAQPAASAFMVHLGIIGQPEMTSIAHARLDDGRYMGLIAPSIADPTAAPEGFGTLELIVLLPNDEARLWFPAPGAIDDARHRASTAYLAAKADLGDRMIAAAEHIVPNLRARIVMRHDASPVTFTRYDWSSDGAIYGIAKADRLKGTRSPLPGLYVAGAGNGGPGIEAVAIAGAAVADAIVPGILRRPSATPMATFVPHVLGVDDSETEPVRIPA